MRILAALLTGGFVLVGTTGWAATFTDRQGRTVDAEISSLSGDTVTMKLTAGGEIDVPLSALVDADQAIVREWEKRGASGAGAGLLVVEMKPWDFDAKSKAIETSKFRVWLPDPTVAVRGMIVLVPGSNGDGRGQVDDDSWRALASELGFGLIGCFFQSQGASYCYAQNGSGEALLDALEEFAKTQDRPEVAEVPLLLWGHSAGGQFNYNFVCWKPERTLAFVVNKGGYYYDTSAKPSARQVPGMVFLGTEDSPERVANLTKLFEGARARGALWALCREAGEGHGVGASQAVAQEFFRAVASVRLPANSLADVDDMKEADGWLGDQETSEIAPAATFDGPTRKASWLPDEAVAQAWQRASR